MDDIPIIEIQSATASVSSPVSTRTIPAPISPRRPSPPGAESPSPPSTPGHRRGKSESQNLLPPTSKNLFQYSTTREFRYDQPEEDGQEGRESPNWQGVAGSLNRTRRQKWRDFLVDVLTIAAGLPFFALAGAIIRLDGKPVKRQQENVLNQCIKGVSTKSPQSSVYADYKKAATLFPLVFSVVVGRLMVKLASWKVERGSTVGSLERLMGSKTVGGTIITQVRLWHFSLAGLGLILLWLLSPVGGQAVLRILSTTSTRTVSNAAVNYLNSRQQVYAGLPAFDSWYPGFAGIFTASLLAPMAVKAGPLDLWGNLKIPYFSGLANVTEDSNGWKQSPQTNYTPSYSSIFGIPISGVPTGNATFNVQSTYVELSCSNRTSSRTRSLNFFSNPGLISTNGPFVSAQNVTFQTLWTMGYLGDNVTDLTNNITIQSLDSLSNQTESGTFLPGLLLYQDFTGSQNVTSIYCVPLQKYIESEITCTQSSPGAPQSCGVTAQRLSLLPHMPNTLTLMTYPQVFNGLSSLLPRSTQQLNHIDLLQNYLEQPLSNSYIQSTPWPSFTSPPTESRLQNISLQDFGDRLGSLINAFLHGAQLNSTTYLTGEAHSLPQQQLATTPSSMSAQIKALSPSFTLLTNSTIPGLDHYSISIPFLALFLLASLVIPLSALVSMILSRVTLSRDYLGCVSSLARESRYVEFPDGGVGLDGLKRSRMCSEWRVRLGDVGDVDGGWSIGTGVALTVGRYALGDEAKTRVVDGRKLYL
ncbi:hypothetical protein BGZ57DRAFT_935843 [Hyaloscypha finlandica]|nr:hypothetical protein BGZ57DRAFT_935843 [Hyaloscypha finlandica]